MCQSTGSISVTEIAMQSVPSVSERFHPARFGFQPYHAGWIKEDETLGPVVIAKLGWIHAQAESFDYQGDERLPIDPLGLVVRLQDRTWGMPPEDLVPVNLLAVTEDTGGAVIVAYQLDHGFNADGWLGFVIGVGASNHTLVSHMLGVHERIRGTRDIGWYLKVVQAYEALQSGHTSMTWTFDPMRGANARLNLEKLGAYVEELAIDKYGPLRSALYGDVPSDRFSAKWDLCSPATHRRLDDVFAGTYPGQSLLDLLDVPEIDPVLPSSGRVCYRIPGDIDALMRSDPQRAIAWRAEMRRALAGYVTMKTRVPGDPEVGPAGFDMRVEPGSHRITGFATGHNGNGERVSYYVLEPKG